MVAAEQLEQQCQRLVEQTREAEGPARQLVREMGLTLEQMEEVRGQA